MTPLYELLTRCIVIAAIVTASCSTNSHSTDSESLDSVDSALKNTESESASATESDTVTVRDTETDSNLITDTDFDSLVGSDFASDSESEYGSDSNVETDFESESNSDSASFETDSESIAECIHPEVQESCKDGWCTIPHGCFVYGAPEAEPCGAPDLEQQTEVVLTHDFIIAQTEVAQAQWEALGFHNPMTSDAICPDCPVGHINWYDAIAYCNAMSEKDGLEKCYDLSGCEGVAGEGCPNEYFTCSESTYKCKYVVNRFENHYECPGYRLPTSAEWQYAARAGTTTATYNGNLPSDLRDCAPQEVLDPIAWHCGNTDKAMPVAQKLSNAWGLYDMLGNIYEWVSDNFDGYSIGHGEERVVDPQGVRSSSWALSNGGSWWREICYVRAGATTGLPKDERWTNWGFRPVRTLTFSEVGTDDTESDTDSDSGSETESGTDTDTDTDSETEGDGGVDDQCIGKDDFSACSINEPDVFGIDLDNDICVDGTCIAVGACNMPWCNSPGQHFAAPPVSGSARFSRSDSGDGQEIVTDSATGLMWQGSLPTIYEGCTEGLSDTECSECMWWEAFEYCDALDLGGYTDWYLPDEHELMSIIDFGVTEPSLDAAIFPGTAVEPFWTSSSFDNEYAWQISLDMGRLDYWYKDFGAFVRCVRREPGGIPATS
jgi:sulfatase modifying factor 1